MKKGSIILFIIGSLFLAGCSSEPSGFIGIIASVVMGLGVILFIVAVIVTTFSMPVSGGIMLFILGLVMLFFNYLSPIKGFIRVVTISLAICAGLFTIVISALTIKSHMKASSVGKGNLLGEEGIAYTKISKKGKVSIHGEIWNAVSKDKIKKKQAVEIIGIEGLTLTVKKKGAQ